MRHNSISSQSASGRSSLAGRVGSLSAVLASLAVVVVILRHSAPGGLVLGVLAVMAVLVLVMGVLVGLQRRDHSN